MKRWWIWIGAVLALLLIDGLLVRWWWSARRDHSQDQVILEAAQRYQVDPAVVKAVIWRESQFDPKAHGKAGEVGLMQISAAVAQEWAAAENITSLKHSALFDARKNALAGTWYLRKLLDRYQDKTDPLPYALADYNAGRRNVLKWLKNGASTNSTQFIDQIDFPTTKAYVRMVMDRHAHDGGSKTK